MSLLREAMEALRSIQASVLAEEAQYVPLRGGAYAIPVVPGRTVFRQTNEYGAYVRTETRDFIVRRECLAAHPSRGDRIVHGARTYEVLSPGGEPCWRWSDAHATAFRIHTKLTEEET